MPQYIPLPQGTLPYPNYETSTSQDFGNILQALAFGMQGFKKRREENRTLADMVGRPRAFANPAVFNRPADLRGGTSIMGNPLQALGFQKQFQAPQPLAISRPNKLQNMIQEAGLSDIKMKDIKSLEGASPLLSLLLGKTPMEDLLLNRLLKEKEIEQTVAQTEKARAETKQVGQGKLNPNKKAIQEEARDYALKSWEEEKGKNIAYRMATLPDASPMEREAARLESEAYITEAMDRFIKLSKKGERPPSPKRKLRAGQTKGGVKWSVEE